MQRLVTRSMIACAAGMLGPAPAFAPTTPPSRSASATSARRTMLVEAALQLLKPDTA